MRSLPIACLMCLIYGSLLAQDTLLLPYDPVFATPLQDDATLHDVTMIGAVGFAVGNHGSIWRTEDGGRSWQFVQSLEGVDKLSLRSVCFLTNRVGWICGGGFLPHTQTHMGVVLHTQDGGNTWTAIGNKLPYLFQIQFFDLQNGIAIGKPSTSFPVGLLTTQDGGQTWKPLNADKSNEWSAGDFLSPAEGVVAGKLGHYGMVAGGAVHEGSSATHGLQAIHAVSMNASGTSWMVGDGAFVRASEDRGITWTPPAAAFPKQLLDYMDFQCVETKGPHVWIAGTPGSVIWHSADSGQTWEPQPTHTNAPISNIHFSDVSHGVAVGDFGQIITTEDGGRTWTSARGSQRRLACLAIHAHTSRTPLQFLTRWANEDGYRSAVMVMSREDVGVDSHRTQNQSLQLQHATLMSGGNHAETAWRFPISIPGLDRDKDKLVDEWRALTDRRLAEVMLSELVARIRMWQPEVILLDEAPLDDAATQTIHQAIQRAVELARDPAQLTDHQTLLGLPPWSVSKIVVQRPVGLSGPIQQPAFAILPHLNTTLDIAVQQPAACLGVETDQFTKPRTYEVTATAPEKQLSSSSIFSDLKISPGSPARRELPSIRQIDYDTLAQQAKHRQTITSISQNMMQASDHGARLLGQVSNMLKPLTREQAAQQLSDLAHMYRQHGQWALAEATYAEMVTNYADQPAALEAMQWLVKFWTSTEMNWQRLRAIGGTNAEAKNAENLVRENFERGLEMVKRNQTALGSQIEQASLDSPFGTEATRVVPTSGDLGSVLGSNGTAGNQYQMKLTRWLEMAHLVSSELKSSYPRLFEDPEMEFVIASLARRRGAPKDADDVYGRYLQLLDDSPWHAAAKGETYLMHSGTVSPKPVVNCKRTRIAPVLDGKLDDPCWADASEIRLGDAPTSQAFVGTKQSTGSVTFVGEKPIAFLSHDKEFLYLAARIPTNDALPKSSPQLGGRTYDADLGLHDQLRFQFDVDRDYATFYEFAIDQRGWCQDSCWEAKSFNPQWYSSVQHDDNVWIMEAAIPLKELVPEDATLAATWALGITRIMPGVGVQSWTNSGGKSAEPARFGFVRFVD